MTAPLDLVTAAVGDPEAFAAECLSAATPTAARSHLHGPAHWRMVAAVGVWLTARTTGARADVAALFAMLHDTQRLSDGHDPDHGPRAATVARQWCDSGRIRLDARGADALVTACRIHTASGPTSDPVVGCCLDADRLTLSRVGITPQNRFLSTAAARTPPAKALGERLASRPPRSWAQALRGSA